MSKNAWKRKFVQLTLSLAASALIAEAAVADLYVTQVGDGSAALTGFSTATFVQKFSNAGGAPAATIALPTTASGANFPLTLGGTATSVGFLSLSGNGQYLMLAGFGVGPGTASIASTTSIAVNRVVGRIDLATQAIDTTTAFSDSSYSGDNIRSVASVDGTSFWTAGTASSGANGGVRYSALGSTTSAQISSTPTNTRNVNIFNGQLYVSTGSGAFKGVNTVGTGVPTTDTQTTTLLTGFDPASASAQSAYDFWFKDANTLYLADDRSATSSGGIQKWEQNAGTWSLSYVLPLGTGTGGGARSIAGVVEGGVTTLYATTTEASQNRLISLVDAGSTSTYTDLSTAPANTAFRAVEFVAGGVTPPANNADFNSDGIVNGDDFLIWQRGFGSTGQPNKSTGDANGDGNVNDADLAIWKSKFDGPPAVAAVGAVPEPATAGLLGFALAALAVIRRRAV